MSDNEAVVESIAMYDICLLHSRADRALRTVVSRQLDKFDITMMEWLMLETVNRAPKEGMTMSSVATALDVTLPQITALSSSLVKAKLINQQVSRQDRRSRRLKLTPAGGKLLSEVELAIKAAEKAWTEKVPDNQLEAYLETVKLLASLNHKH